MADARWKRDAIDLSATPGEASKYLTVGQLSDAISLSEGTILDSITRAPITNTDNPRSAICVPAAYIANLPLWSKAQCQRFLRIQQEAEDAADVIKSLEAVNAEEAQQRGLHSFTEYAEMFGVHEQTLRRAQSHEKDFPRAIARRRKATPGVPEHLFEIKAMTEWAESKGYGVPEQRTAPARAATQS